MEEQRRQRRKQSLTAWCWQWGGDTVNLTQANLDDSLTHLVLAARGGPQGGGLLISDVGAEGGGMSFGVLFSNQQPSVLTYSSLERRLYVLGVFISL